MRKFCFWFFLFAKIPAMSFALSFVPCTESCLNQPASEVPVEEINSPSIQEIIHQMVVLSGHEADDSQTEKSGVLVGLAAPQVGIMKKIILVDTQEVAQIKKNQKNPSFEILINPEIINRSSFHPVGYEGCYSVPEKYFGAVKRPQSLQVRAYNQKGDEFIKTYTGQAARIVHHEIDHLEGIRFPQRLESEKDLHLCHGEDDLTAYRRKWKRWKKHASVDLWEQMKNGFYTESN